MSQSQTIKEMVPNAASWVKASLKALRDVVGEGCSVLLPSPHLQSVAGVGGGRTHLLDPKLAQQRCDPVLTANALLWSRLQAQSSLCCPLPVPCGLTCGRGQLPPCPKQRGQRSWDQHPQFHTGLDHTGRATSTSTCLKPFCPSRGSPGGRGCPFPFP